MNDEHLYLIAYDISDPKRLRNTFKLLRDYGEWVQFSIFQCRLNRMRRIQLQAEIDEIIHHNDDHVIIIDLGLADSVAPHVTTLGKQRFAPIERRPLIF
jgi:CRISPR-associated protein Cas2